jgi:hypothetical protein
MNWQELIDNEWYYVPGLALVCLWAFGLGWIIGLILLKIN